MIIALASPSWPSSVDEGVTTAERYIVEAASKGASIICFPESYIPGYPVQGFDENERTPEKLDTALTHICNMAALHSIAVIMPMDKFTENGLLNVAYVISNQGDVLGYQAKVQLDPSEDSIWVPGTNHQIFDIEGLRFGVTICHEGFRYPEATRWAARRGAQIVFHPNCTGSNLEGVVPTEWCSAHSPYYEKATTLRALENTIYFASVNYCFIYPESATAVVAPDGHCVGHQPYTVPGVLVADIDLSVATGVLARRLRIQNSEF